MKCSSFVLLAVAVAACGMCLVSNDPVGELGTLRRWAQKSVKTFAIHVRSRLGVGSGSASSPGGNSEAEITIISPLSETIIPTRQEGDELLELIEGFSPPLTAVLNRLQSPQGGAKRQTDKLFQRALVQYLTTENMAELALVQQRKKKKTSPALGRQDGTDEKKKKPADSDVPDERETPAAVKRMKLLQHKAAYLIQSFNMDFSDREQPEAAYKAAALRYLRRALFQ